MVMTFNPIIQKIARLLWRIMKFWNFIFNVAQSADLVVPTDGSAQPRMSQVFAARMIGVSPATWMFSLQVRPHGIGHLGMLIKP